MRNHRCSVVDRIALGACVGGAALAFYVLAPGFIAPRRSVKLWCAVAYGAWQDATLLEA